MFNLFSSFDMFFFKIPMLSLLMFFFIFIEFWFVSMKSLCIKTLLNFFMLNFLSLKLKKFNKSMINMFISVMIMVFIMNFMGSMPFMFPMTSQMSFVFMVSMILWMVINLFFILKSTKSFLSHNVPEGTPSLMIFFLFLIEVISNLIRPITLTMRLMGNIVSGHIFLSLIFLLIYNMSSVFLILYILYMMVELFIGFLQAYIMTTLMIMYYSDL